MTANEYFESAKALLGYGMGEALVASYPFEVNALFFFNCSYFELTGQTAPSLDTEIKAAPAVLDALPFGIAMLLALYAGDEAKQNFLAEVFEKKRRLCKGCKTLVKDVLPRC